MRVLATALALCSLGVSAWAAPPAPDPDLAGFPKGYFLPCSQAPAGAVVTVPAPFDAHMRVLCTVTGAALAPPKGYRWVFANGMVLFLSALNPKDSSVTGVNAYFTRLASAPLSVEEAAAFRARLAPVVKNRAILEADILRLEVDTSTGDHKQEYLLVGRAGGVWGIECYNDCNPMDSPPRAFTVTTGR